MCETPSMPAPESPANPGRVYLILLAVYFGFVVYGSLVPLEFRDVPFEQAVRKFREIPYLQLGIQSRSDLVANFLLFIPLTFVAMGALTRENRRRGKPIIAVATAATAIALSVGIEFTQIYFPGRTVSQNDILAETIGGVVGIVLWCCCGGRITQWARSLQADHAGGRLAVNILSGYAVFLILYQIFPFDLTISPAEVYHKWKASKVNIFPFCDPGGVAAYTFLSKTVVMIPIGYLLMLLQRRRQHLIRRVVAQVCLFAVLIESAQLFVFSRYSSSTDVVFGTAGGLLGAGAAMMFGPVASRPVLETDFWRRCGTWIKLIATVALVGGLAWEKWYPFDFAWPVGGLAVGATEILAVPFARQYASPEFLALSQVVRELTAFFILGMLLRSLLVPGSKAGKIGGVLVVVVIAVVFEFGQVFLASRTADLTAMVISGTGGIMGVRMFRGFARVFIKTDLNSTSIAKAGQSQ